MGFSVGRCLCITIFCDYKYLCYVWEMEKKGMVIKVGSVMDVVIVFAVVDWLGGVVVSSFPGVGSDIWGGGDCVLYVSDVGGVVSLGWGRGVGNYEGVGVVEFVEYIRGADFRGDFKVDKEVI